jgi:uncharacterized Fe-S radical SAM superfamily protein PflX
MKAKTKQCKSSSSKERADSFRRLKEKTLMLMKLLQTQIQILCRVLAFCKFCGISCSGIVTSTFRFADSMLSSFFLVFVLFFFALL